MSVIESLKYTGDILGKRADKENAALTEAKARETSLRADLKAARDKLRSTTADVAKLEKQQGEARNDKARGYFEARIAQARAVLPKIEADVERLSKAVKSAADKVSAGQEAVSRLVRDQQGMYTEAARLEGAA